MLYALISDVHANRQALRAVMTDAAALEVDSIICLGDVVGYGPSPAEVLTDVYAHVDHILLGNHDAAVGGRLDPACFNENARRLVQWTREQIDGKARRFLGGLPAVADGDGFRCVHAELAMPLRFGYILEAEDAVSSWQVCSDPLIFVGHSHQPGIFITGQSGRAYALAPQDFQAEEGKRYIVNVGSVGQPRDDDVRASYVVYDSEAGSVYFRRVPFDLDSFRNDVTRQGLAEASRYFLSVAESTVRQPIREVLDFQPLTKAEAEKSGEATVARLEQAESTARRWMMIGVVLSVLLVIAAGIATLAYYRFRPDHTTLVGEGYERVVPLDPVSQDQTLPVAFPESEEFGGHAGLDGWRARVPRTGSVSMSAGPFADFADGDPRAGFRLESAAAEPFELRSAGFAVQGGMRFAVQGRFRVEKWESGFLEMALVLCTPDGTEQVLIAKEPPGLEEAEQEWLRLSSRTMRKANALDRAGQLHYVLRGQFAGRVEVADCQLVLKAD